MQTSSVSADQLSALAALIDRLPAGAPTPLDPRDPAHRAAIEAALAAAGRTPERYPALYQALDGSHGDGGADHIMLLDRGADTSGRATAMTWHAAGAGALYSGGTLFAFDGDSNELLAMGHNSSVADGFVPISTQTATAQPVGKNLKTLSLNHSAMESGAVRFSALATSGPIVDGGVTFNIDQPTLTPVHPPNVTIAVGRKTDWVNKDVDYWYEETTNQDNPYLIVPFKGNAIIPYQVTGTAGQPISGAQLSTQLFFVGNGTTIIPMNTTYTKNFASSVTLDSANSSQVDWSYAYTQGSSYSNTTSLVFDPQSLVNDHTSYFAYNFQVPITNAPTPYFTFTVCSRDTPEQSSPQCHKILCDLTFTWHCLAAGTLVTLAGGGTAAIETLDNSKRVDNGGGGDLAVEATTFGSHQATSNSPSAQAVYRLTTDAGHELVGSAQHPIQTPDGLVPLESLAKGATVMTVNGTAKVTACVTIDFDGKMHNLKLGDESDRSAGLSEDAVCMYVANGIVVGDHHAQRLDHRRRVRDITYMAPRLPKALVADYASAIADIRY